MVSKKKRWVYWLLLFFVGNISISIGSHIGDELLIALSAFFVGVSFTNMERSSETKTERNTCNYGCEYEPGVRGCPIHDWHKGEA